MLPIQFIFLLILVTLPRQMAEATGTGGTFPSGHLESIPVSVTSLIFMQAMVVGLVWVKARRAIRRLNEPGSGATPLLAGMDHVFSWARWTTGLITGVHLFGTPLGTAALVWFGRTQVLQYLLLPELLFLLPAVLAWLGIWVAAYHLEEAMRERTLPYYLAQGLPVHEMPQLGSYLMMQMRHNFYPFVFMLFQGLVTVLGAGITRLVGHSKDAGDVIAMVGCGMSLLLLLPFLLTRIWSTMPLTGALRERLNGVAERYGLRFRNILLWRSHNMMVNAAIVGWVPKARYFLMSDALVESMSDEQLESVFAHEVGHGVHHHLHWLILAVFSAVGLATGLTTLAAAGLTARWHWDPQTVDLVMLVASSLFLCVFAGATVWLVSPRNEHQADWFACRHMALKIREEGRVTAEMALVALAAAPTMAEGVTVEQYAAGAYPHSGREAEPLSPVTPPSAAPILGIAEAVPVNGSAVASMTRASAGMVELMGAEVFISALDSLVEKSHKDRTRRGLFHPSVANRVALVRKLAVDPAAEAQFNRQMRRMRWWIVLLAVVGTGVFAGSLFVPQPSPAAAGSQGSASTSAPAASQR